MSVCCLLWWLCLGFWFVLGGEAASSFWQKASRSWSFFISQHALLVWVFLHGGSVMLRCSLPLYTHKVLYEYTALQTFNVFLQTKIQYLRSGLNLNVSSRGRQKLWANVFCRFSDNACSVNLSMEISTLSFLTRIVSPPALNRKERRCCTRMVSHLHEVITDPNQLNYVVWVVKMSRTSWNILLFSYYYYIKSFFNSITQMSDQIITNKTLFTLL